MSANINYCSVLFNKAALLTTGDTSRIAPSGGGTPIFDSANGGMVERITVMPLATTVASCVRLFLYDGTTADLKLEIPLPALTVTAAGAVTPITLSASNYPDYFPIIVKIGSKLTATVNDTQTGIKVHAEGGGA